MKKRDLKKRVGRTEHRMIKLLLSIMPYLHRFQREGRLAQLVERTLSMREVGGSKPPLSTLFSHVEDVTRAISSIGRAHA
jgi:hypothetical protein